MGKWEELLGTQSIGLASTPGTTANPAGDLAEQPHLRFPGLWMCHVAWAGGVQSLAVTVPVWEQGCVGCRCSALPSASGVAS